MKLRSKGTGEIKEAEARDDGIYLYSVETEQWFKYDLSLLAEYWEYYVEPKEPLIKDEKTRNAIRAWAEANAINEYPSESSVMFDSVEHRLTWVSTCIEFNESRNLENLKHNETYTITELCGEEDNEN